MPNTLQTKELNQHDLEVSGFRLTATGLVPNGNPSYDDWTQCGEWLKRAEKAVGFWIGDWLNYGERKWGEMYSQAMEETGLEYSTLKTYANVTRKLDLSIRIDNLPFAHHQIVATDDLTRDEKEMFLEAAAPQNGDKKPSMTVRELKAEIKAYKRKQQYAAQNRNLETSVKWWCGDFRDADIEPESVDIIFTDPPYPKEYIPLYSDLGRLAHFWLKDGGTLAVLCGQLYLPEIFTRLSECGLRYSWTMCYLTPGGKSPQIWTEKVNTFWKPVLLFSKGTPNREWIGDVASSKTNSTDQDSADEWAQSENGMKDIAQRLIKPGDVVIDPFCGSGTNAIAAIELGASFFGIDINAEDIETCVERIGGNVTR